MPGGSVNPFLLGDSTIRSLNRTRVATLPGLQVDEGIVGKRGYDLLAAHSLRGDIVAEAEALGLDPSAPDLLEQFDHCLAMPDTRPIAVSLAHRYGRRLGFFLLMLHRGDDENRAVRPEWGDAHWAFWRGVREIFLGGGLMAGEKGKYILEAARTVLDEHGLAELVLKLSPHASHLPLLGLARTAPPDATGMLVLDFGQSSIKRALASYEDGVLVALDLLPPVPTVCGNLFQPTTLEMAQQRWERMLAIIEESWCTVALAQYTPTAMGISLACYLFNGHPSPLERGCYGALQLLCENLELFMREQIAARLGITPPFVLMHDGAAAAAAYAGATGAVVLTLGTAIGSGFPPSSQGYRPVSP